MNQRIEAANLLRMIRALQLQRAGDLIEWAVTIMPDRISTQRLYIRWLLASGDPAAAESAAQRASLQYPNCASLSLLKAESLADQRRWPAADLEIQKALHRRPHHHRTRLLAARIAMARCDHHRAIAILENANHPLDDAMRALLAEALLRIGDIHRAQQSLDAMQSPAPRLIAEVLQAQGRILDAADVLEAALQQTPDEQTLCMLLSLLEEIGDESRLQQVINQVRPEHVQARAFIGKMLLARGAFRSAVLHAAALAREAPSQTESLYTLVVAAALLGRQRLAQRALARIKRSSRSPETRNMAQHWQRGMLGRLLQMQHDAKQAGSDPGSSVLGALLAEAETAIKPLTKDRRIKDSAGAHAQLSERNSVVVSSLSQAA